MMDWLASGKSAAELPDRFKEWLNKRTGGGKAKSAQVKAPQLTNEQIAVLQYVLDGRAGSKSRLFFCDLWNTTCNIQFRGRQLSELHARTCRQGSQSGGEAGPRSRCHRHVHRHGGAVTVALDSGATTSCFKEGSEFRVLSQPITVRGALPGLTSVARGTTELPCPALPSGTLRGLHSPNFRHNLVSLGDLQKKGVEVLFPAGTSEAMCLDPKTGKVLWRFKRSPQGLYEARVLSSEEHSPS